MLTKRTICAQLRSAVFGVEKKSNPWTHALVAMLITSVVQGMQYIFIYSPLSSAVSYALVPCFQLKVTLPLRIVPPFSASC